MQGRVCEWSAGQSWLGQVFDFGQWVSQRSTQEGKKTAAGTQTWEIALCANVGNMERAMLAYPAKLWLIINTDLDSASRQRTKMSSRNHEFVLNEPQQHVIDLANAR